MIKLVRVVFAFFLLFAVPNVAIADDVYDVANIKVMASGKDGIAAKSKALRLAESKAVIILFDRILTPGQKKRALAKLDSETRSLLVKGFSVKNEQSGGGQYIAEITIKFRRVAVQQYLSQIGASYSDAQSELSLLLPILTNASGSSIIWSGENAWSDALSSFDLRNGLMPLKIVTASDAGLLASEQEILNSNENALYQLASSVSEGAESIIAHMTISNTHAMLKVTGLVRFSRKYTIKDGDLETTLQRAAGDFLANLANDWRKDNITSKPKLATIKVLVVFDSLSKWIALRGRLSRIRAIGEYDTDAMTADGAYINIHHRGTVVELADEMQLQGLHLIHLGAYYEIRG